MLLTLNVHFAEKKLPPEVEDYANFGAIPESFDAPPPYGVEADGYPGTDGNIPPQVVGANVNGTFPSPPPPGLQNVAIVIDPLSVPLPANAPESYMCFAICVRYSLCILLGKFAINYSRKSPSLVFECTVFARIGAWSRIEVCLV